MRALMGLIKNRHGTYYARQKVPERLQAAVAEVLGNGKARQAYLKKSLGTKDLRQANIRGKLVLAGFDRTIRDATAIAKRPPVTPLLCVSLNETEITRMADYVFAKTLAWDERFRVGGRDELRLAEAWLQTELKKEERELGPAAYSYETLPQHGWSPAQLKDNREQLEGEPFELAELQLIFDAPVFRGMTSPLGAKGDAGVWLPLVALFTGARQSEIAGLTVGDVQQDAATGIHYLLLTEELKEGKRLKTKMSQRAIPVHSQLLSFGFLKYVQARRRSGEKVWLFTAMSSGRVILIALS